MGLSICVRGVLYRFRGSAFRTHCLVFIEEPLTDVDVRRSQVVISGGLSVAIRIWQRIDWRDCDRTVGADPVDCRPTGQSVGSRSRSTSSSFAVCLLLLSPCTTLYSHAED